MEMKFFFFVVELNFFPSPLFSLARLPISLLPLYPFHPNNCHFVSGSLSSLFFFFNPSSASVAIDLNRFRFPGCTFPYGVLNLMKVYVFRWLIKLNVILKMINPWNGFFFIGNQILQSISSWFYMVCFLWVSVVERWFSLYQTIKSILLQSIFPMSWIGYVQIFFLSLF